MFNRAIGGEITQDGDYLVFEGNRYDRRGFLYKNFVMAAIVSITLVDFFFFYLISESCMVLLLY